MPSSAAGPNASRRKTPAFEDVWLGFAAYALLPPAARNVTYVSLAREYVFDDWGFVMKVRPNTPAA